MRRVAQSETLGDFAAQAAVLSIGNRRWRGAQLFAIVIGCALHDLDQTGRCLLRQRRRRGSLPPGWLARYRKPDGLRQLVHRFDKAQSAMLHQKANRAAVRAATEAVVKLLTGADRERWRFFVMKRTQADKVRAAFFSVAQNGRPHRPHRRRRANPAKKRAESRRRGLGPNPCWRHTATPKSDTGIEDACHHRTLQAVEAF